MNESELDRRLTRLVTRRISANMAGLNGVPQLGCVETLGELDGFLSKIAKSIKRTIVAPIKMLGATVKAIKTGSIAPIKDEIKAEVQGIKSDLITIAPVAAVVANIIPGVGQLISAGIAAVGTGLKIKEKADEAKEAAIVAQREQEIATVQAQEAYDLQIAAQQAEADKQATEQAAQATQARIEADAIIAKTAELKKQADEIAARTAQANADAQLRASQFQAASLAAKQAQQTGLIKAGMPVDEITAQIIRQNLANNGTLMNSPEAQELVYDVARDANAQIQTAGVSGDISKMLPWLAVGAATFFMFSRSSAPRRRRRK